MDVGLQCTLSGFDKEQKSFFNKLEDRIIESQKHLFLKTEKIIKSQSDLIKSQNEKIGKLNKLVEVHNETIGTLDARLEIIYRFLNKEIKDLEGKLWVKLDSLLNFITHQFYFVNNYSIPEALSPITKSLTDIKRNTLLDKEGLASSGINGDIEEDINCNLVSEAIVDMDGASEVKTVKQTGGEFSIDTGVSVDKVSEDCSCESSTDSGEISNNTNHSGLNFICKNLGLSNDLDSSKSSFAEVQDPGSAELLTNDLGQLPVPRGPARLRRRERRAADRAEEVCAANENQTNLKRKVKETDSLDVASESIEDGEILDDDIGSTSPVPYGRIYVRTKGIFKDEVLQSKKWK